MTETVADLDGYVFEPVHGPKRRVVFEPRSDGDYDRVEAVWTGCRWRPTGRERVLSVRTV